MKKEKIAYLSLVWDLFGIFLGLAHVDLASYISAWRLCGSSSNISLSIASGCTVRKLKQASLRVLLTSKNKI
jgi:hypothetical protein